MIEYGAGLVEHLALSGCSSHRPLVYVQAVCFNRVHDLKVSNVNVVPQSPEVVCPVQTQLWLPTCLETGVQDTDGA